MKKPTPKKKETVLDVLLRIENEIKMIRSGVAVAVSSNELIRSITEMPAPKANEIIVDFPAKTMKETCEETGNKAGDGKLLYDVSWYANEEFYTTEKCRAGKRIVSLELAHKGKSWNECKSLLKDGDEMLSPAEVVYLLAYVPEYREVLKGWNYTWTSGRGSGGSLVFVGAFDGLGAVVFSRSAGYSRDSLGLSFSRRA